jgi:hypothetical protein
MPVDSRRVYGDCHSVPDLLVPLFAISAYTVLDDVGEPVKSESCSRLVPVMSRGI